jgi:hypothetical protein
MIPTLLGSDVGALGHLWSQHDVIMSWLKLTATPQTASHIHIRHIRCVWACWYAIYRHMVAALHIYTHPTWLRCWGSGSLVESKWCHYVMVEGDGHTSNCFPNPYKTYRMSLSTLICWPWAYGSSCTRLYPPYLAQMLGLWVTWGVKMMSLCHGWSWQPPQTASHIHIRYIQSVWAHWYAVQRHIVAALHSYTNSNRLRFGGSGSLVESKWC